MTMAGEQIFIVEDERIVAEDLKRMLERLGYNVVGSAASGDEAIKKVEASKPHLVLMDIRLQGALDGVDVAEHMVAEFDIPVIYLTAYADETTVDRAKGTLPSGYILKPFEERSLKTTIELALYRHSMDRLIKNVEDWHGGILEGLGVAVLAVDTQGNVAYMNKGAEVLTGHNLDKAFGKPLETVLPFKKDASGALPTRFTLERQGRRISVDCRESTIKDLDGKVMGRALALQEATPPR
jgi:PAS domain S-box-containing protein